METLSQPEDVHVENSSIYNACADYFKEKNTMLRSWGHWFINKSKKIITQLKRNCNICNSSIPQNFI